MTDKEIIDILGKYKIIKWSLLHDNIKTYLLNRFNDNYSTNIINQSKESYYRIQNNIDICQRCQICNNKCKFNGSKYILTCGNPKCSARECQSRREKTFFEKYGVNSQFGRDTVRQHIKETNIQKYGVDNPWKTIEVQNKCKSTIIKNNGGLGAASNVIKEKMKQTCLEKYGCGFSVQSKLVQQHRRENCFKKYGVTHTMKLSWHQDKINKTKKKNHTFNTSKPEIISFDMLKEKYPDVMCQYKDKDRYPFICDFYIPSLDLFIECNYHWTHGRKPYEGTEEDHKIIDGWKSKNSKYYNNAINTWTNRDVKKRNIAEENGLNYKEFFTILDLENWLNEYETTK